MGLGAFLRKAGKAALSVAGEILPGPLGTAARIGSKAIPGGGRRMPPPSARGRIPATVGRAPGTGRDLRNRGGFIPPEVARSLTTGTVGGVVGGVVGALPFPAKQVGKAALGALAGSGTPAASGGVSLVGVTDEKTALMATKGQIVVGANVETRMRAPRGFVVVQLPIDFMGFPAGAKVAMYKPIARKLGWWKPRPKPPITAAEWKTLKTANRVERKAQKIAKEAGFKVLTPMQHHRATHTARKKK